MKIGLLLICRKKEVAAQLMKKVDDNLLKLFKIVFETPVQASFRESAFVMQTYIAFYTTQGQNGIDRRIPLSDRERADGMKIEAVASCQGSAGH